jgi:thousand and one amino acid protein kinase
MENHKQMLDKEYETLLTSFRKELEKLHIKHQQELERKVRISHDPQKILTHNLAYINS